MRPGVSAENVNYRQLMQGRNAAKSILVIYSA
jgi:hypothetical protein